MMNTIKNLWQRFQSGTPKIARRVRNISAFVSGMALAVMTALLAAQSSIPEWFNKAYPYLIGIPAAIAFISQFQSNNNNDEKK